MYLNFAVVLLSYIFGQGSCFVYVQIIRSRVGASEGYKSL